MCGEKPRPATRKPSHRVSDEGHLSWRSVLLRPGECVGGAGLGQGLQVRQVALEGLGQRSGVLQAEPPSILQLWAPESENTVTRLLRPWPHASRDQEGRTGHLGGHAGTRLHGEGRPEPLRSHGPGFDSLVRRQGCCPDVQGSPEVTTHSRPPHSRTVLPADLRRLPRPPTALRPHGCRLAPATASRVRTARAAPALTRCGPWER